MDGGPVNTGERIDQTIKRRSPKCQGLRPSPFPTQLQWETIYALCGRVAAFSRLLPQSLELCMGLMHGLLTGWLVGW